jgi:hypothetical protein
VVGAVFIIISFIIFVIGLLGDLIAINRRLNEETLYYIKQMALKQKDAEFKATHIETTVEIDRERI